jgi:hypothetical protein
MVGVVKWCAGDESKRRSMREYVKVQCVYDRGRAVFTEAEGGEWSVVCDVLRARQNESTQGELIFRDLEMGLR